MLTHDVLRMMNKLLLYVFIPSALVFAMGTQVTLDMLGASVGVVAWSAVHLGVSFALGAVLRRLIAIPPHFRVATMVACTFNNSISLPIVLFIPLSKYIAPWLTGPGGGGGDADALFQQILAFLWMYLILWQVGVWGVALPLAVREREQLESAARAPVPFCSADILRETAAHTVRSPPIIGIVVGVAVGLIPGVSDVLFGPQGELRVLGTVIESLSDAMPASANLVLAASLFFGIRETIAKGALGDFRWCPRWCGCRRGVPAGAGSPAASGTVGGVPDVETGGAAVELSEAAVAGAVPATKAAPAEEDSIADTGDSAPASDASHASTASSGRVPDDLPEGSLDHARHHRVPWSAIAGIIVIRLIIAPALVTLLYWGVAQLGPSLLAPDVSTRGSGAVVTLVVLVVACMPSAQFLLVMIQMAGNTRAAEHMAVLYVLQYPVAAVTVSAWLALAMALVFG